MVRSPYVCINCPDQDAHPLKIWCFMCRVIGIYETRSAFCTLINFKGIDTVSGNTTLQWEQILYFLEYIPLRKGLRAEKQEGNKKESCVPLKMAAKSPGVFIHP